MTDNQEELPFSAPNPALEETPTKTYTCDKCGDTTQEPRLFIFDKDNNKTYCRDCASECSSCHEIINNNDIRTDDNGENYCDSCYDETYFYCPACEEERPVDEYLAPTNRNRTGSRRDGGCTECSAKCNNCSKIVDKEDSSSYDGDFYCEDCFSDSFISCYECGETVHNEDAMFENDGGYCEDCYEKHFTKCYDCEDTIEIKSSYEYDGENYCEDCYEKVSMADTSHFSEMIDKMENFSFNKKDRYLNKLIKLCPISVKELKEKYPALAQGVQDIIKYSKGKDLTIEIINDYKKSLPYEEFPVEYSSWKDMQRSIETLSKSPVNTPQLVINIIASSAMLTDMKSNLVVYDLFEKINEISRKSGHPYKKDQLGWARLEIDPNKEFILVDEIQTDHANAIYKLKNEKNYEMSQIKDQLKRNYKLNDAQLLEVFDKVYSYVRDFPDIATQAISTFARTNGFKKLFWHTYESGKELKRNSPPKSLYDKTPKENFFLPSQEKPFGLEGEFFEREAKSINNIIKLARRLTFKHFS